jgi:hypothetical protein
MRLQALIDLLDKLTERLVGAGVEPERVADAYKIAAARAEYRSSPASVRDAAERVRAAAEASLSGKGAYSGPERRRPGRPWSKPSL